MTRDELIITVRDAIRQRGEQIGETVGWCGDLDAEYAEVAVDAVLDGVCAFIERLLDGEFGEGRGVELVDRFIKETTE